MKLTIKLLGLLSSVAGTLAAEASDATHPPARTVAPSPAEEKPKPPTPKPQQPTAPDTGKVPEAPKIPKRPLGGDPCPGCGLG